MTTLHYTDYNIRHSVHGKVSVGEQLLQPIVCALCTRVARKEEAHKTGQ